MPKQAPSHAWAPYRGPSSRGPRRHVTDLTECPWPPNKATKRHVNFFSPESIESHFILLQHGQSVSKLEFSRPCLGCGAELEVHRGQVRGHIRQGLRHGGSLDRQINRSGFSEQGVACCRPWHPEPRRSFCGLSLYPILILFALNFLDLDDGVPDLFGACFFPFSGLFFFLFFSRVYCLASLAV